MNQTENSKQVNGEEEISLLDLIAVIWRYKVMIICITVFAMIAVLTMSVISLVLPPEKSFLPNEYTPYAQMLINDKNESGGLSSMLNSSGLGGLASLAGIDVGGGSVSNSALAGYLVKSNSLLDAVIERFNLVERYKIDKYPKAETRKALMENLVSSMDEETGVFTVSFTDIDPVFAQEVVNFTVDFLEKRFLEMGLDKNQLSKTNLEDNIENSYCTILDLQKRIQEIEYSVSNVYSSVNTPSIMLDTALLKMELTVQEQVYAQLKAQYEALKVTMASEQPVFQILEYAEVPDKKSGPSRGMLCIVVTFAAGFFSVFLAFLLNAIKNIKADPEAMAKLKSKKDGE